MRYILIYFVPLLTHLLGVYLLEHGLQPVGLAFCIAALVLWAVITCRMHWVPGAKVSIISTLVALGAFGCWLRFIGAVGKAHPIDSSTYYLRHFVEPPVYVPVVYVVILYSLLVLFFAVCAKWMIDSSKWFNSTYGEDKAANDALVQITESPPE